VKAIRGEVGGAMTEAVLEIKVSAAVESPCAIRGCAALTGTADSEVSTVRVVVSQYAKESFNVVESVFKHVALDAGNLVGNAERATDNGTE
jgi:hypothetical protein